MKKILGLDLGTTSIGWAFVHEAENEKEQSSIINLGVRVNPLTTDEQTDFEKGRPLSVNADRTLKRGARRNLQRYKQRRESLIELLSNRGIITEQAVLAEIGQNTTYETLRLRALAAREYVTKDELARILLAINKKRGYKSSRKAKADEDGQLIDGMSIAQQLYDEDLTPGQYCCQLLEEGKKNLPDFYCSDLHAEFDKVWEKQKEFYPELMTYELYEALQGKNSGQTWKICETPFGLVGIKREGKAKDKKMQNYQWRAKALERQMELEYLAVVLQEINGNISNSSGYLGAISDRSKELIFNKETVGENLYKQIQKNPHTSLKNQVFYRKDYLDEFEQIWETQKQFHPELNEELKREVRDITIFYQRRLKSQKGLISYCEFESKQMEVDINGKKKVKTIGSRVCPKSSPLFQEFKIWQNLSHVIIKSKGDKADEFVFTLEHKKILFDVLNIKGTLKKAEVFKVLGLKLGEWELNYSELQGNTTNVSLYSAYAKILEHEGYELNLKKEAPDEIKEKLTSVFKHLGIDVAILEFNAELDGKYFEQQASFRLWHLLYSYEGDKSNTGTDALYDKLEAKFGFKREHAQYLINVQFQDDYGSLSRKAIHKIMPYIVESEFSEACLLAGYNHSGSLTKEENNNRPLKAHLELVAKNSLRNPVVEKILNQMVNVINAIIDDPTMGKPDEVRIELARELKKNARERQEMTSGINKSKAVHEVIRAKLQIEFGIKNPSRNDLIRYKLYKELEMNGYRTLYTNQYISAAQLFSKEIDIEHIIPKARLFDDSFSNKTLEFRQVNLNKSDETAYDFIKSTYGDERLNEYLSRIEKYYNDGHINKAKYQKLLKKGVDIGDGFIERDLRESQYIAKKAKGMLLELCRSVVSTTGSITDRLRADWGLINTMKELNIDKYRALGMTAVEERKDGQRIEKIIDWTKRNDHRHHAMDALTVAFTKHNHIQYLNNLNARKNERDKKHRNIIAIEVKETYRNEDGRRLFKEPIENFRKEAKKHLMDVLISHKAKNKVVTRNRNKVKGSADVQVALTPRGQLHKETVYSKIQSYATKEVKIGATFDESMIVRVAKRSYREALLQRLGENENNPKKAFGGKNSLAKNPICTKEGEELPVKVKIVWLEDNFTIRKRIDSDLKIDKVIDMGVKRILQERLREFDGKAKEAFVNLEQNPIWLNKEKGISIKRVTISGVSNAEAIHCKKDHLGKPIFNGEGREIPADYVSTGNNHHVAIYRDENGKLQEEVVSFYEAVARVNANLSIVNKEHKNGWEFLFTMKQNEMFVFPSDKLDPSEIDLLNPENRRIISENLFRVQKISTKNYVFNHHLETKAVNNDTLKNKELSKVGYNFIQTPDNLKGIIKVRTNHLGHIVKVGE